MHNGQHNSQKHVWRVLLKYHTYLSASKDDRGSWRLGSVGDSNSLGRRLWEAQKVNMSVPYYRWHRTRWPQEQHAHGHFSNLQVNGCAVAFVLPLTSSMTTQICFTHSMIEWGVPAMVMARSVEFGSMSPATCTWAPVDCKKIQIRKTKQSAKKCENVQFAQFYHMFVALPREFPWSCNHLSQWGSHTGWQAPQYEGWLVACWWLCCLSLSC